MFTHLSVSNTIISPPQKSVCFGAAVFLVEKMNEQNGVRKVHDGGHEKYVVLDSAARHVPTSVVVESSESDKNSDKHLRQLKKSDGLGRPTRNSNSIGSQGIVRVHERVDKVVHTTEDGA